MATSYPVNDIFTSIQGEGHWAGVYASFIRLQGCPVGCEWCDSGPRAAGFNSNTWGLKGGEMLTTAEIIDKLPAVHVVVTGGEPTIHRLDSLFSALHLSGHFVQLETSGLNPLHLQRPDWITWSPKHSLDYEADEMYWREAHEVKFVVDEHFGSGVLAHFYNVLETMRTSSGGREWPVVTLMPEGCPPKSHNIHLAMKIVKEACEWGYHDTRITDRLQFRWDIP